MPMLADRVQSQVGSGAASAASSCWACSVACSASGSTATNSSPPAAPAKARRRLAHALGHHPQQLVARSVAKLVVNRLKPSRSINNTASCTCSAQQGVQLLEQAFTIGQAGEGVTGIQFAQPCLTGIQGIQGWPDWVASARVGWRLMR